MHDPLVLNGQDLKISELARVLGAEPPALELSNEARERCRASRAVIEDVMRRGDVVYGVNTGFGKLARIRIEASRLEELQRNLILSHATGVGPALPPEVSRLMLVLRIAALSRGHSGVREALLDRLLLHYREGWIPVVPEQGSVGASGDLAPLAHIAITLLGDGELWIDGVRRKTADVFAERGIEPFALSAKEGLALINGTQCMTAIGIATWLHADTLVKTADIAAAMTIEALRGSIRPFHPDVHEARGQLGQLATARNVVRLLDGSEIIPSHQDCEKVQDPYSMRCVPQVHGATRDAVNFVHDILEREASAVTDNPLIFENGEVVSAGNFHGQPVSQALDFLGIAVATLASISERRIENMVNPDLSGLPAFLAPDPGLNSGFMIPQVVAASLVSENKSLAHPASVDSIPTSANREDHVSMGVTAARHARDITNNVASVLGIEVICAAQGLEFDRRLGAGRGAEAAYKTVRSRVPKLEQDRYLAPDLAAGRELVSSRAILDAVEAEVGALE
ncbi:MAG: histidine ammonia-lyase [Planctomycetes bacterium]|nr:histidine ammonia-lyase [Planctomycetota bacterium]